MKSIVICAVLASIALGACETMPAPPANSPPRLSVAEMSGIEGRLRSDVAVAVGQPLLPQAAVARDQALITIPYAYRHTAVLTEDVEGFSFTVSGVQAPKGSPGYYAGISATAPSTGAASLTCGASCPRRPAASVTRSAFSGTSPQSPPSRRRASIPGCGLISSPRPPARSTM